MQLTDHYSTEPARFIRKLEDTYFRLREPLSLQCSFTGSQRVSVAWRKDGKLIWASYKYNVKTTEDTCILEVLNSDGEEAAGKYSCEISNVEGSDICHANVMLGTKNLLNHFHWQNNSCNKLDQNANVPTHITADESLRTGPLCEKDEKQLL